MKIPYMATLLGILHVPNNVASEYILHFKLGKGKLCALGCFMQSYVQFSQTSIIY